MWTGTAQLDKLLRHMDYVRINCEIIGKKLIDMGRVTEGLNLIAQGYIHDNSKLFGIEFKYLTGAEVVDQKAFELALEQHRSTNPHHVEYWTDITKMPDLYLAEMVADCKARSTEFGQSLVDWLEEEATKRYQFVKGDETWNRIITFVDMACDRPFKPIESNDNAKDQI